VNSDTPKKPKGEKFGDSIFDLRRHSTIPSIEHFRKSRAAFNELKIPRNKE